LVDGELRERGHDVVVMDLPVDDVFAVRHVDPIATLDVQDDNDVCLVGTHWRRLQCARQSAQNRSEDHQAAANANQRTNKKTGLKS
jgi:hypothetical protein